MAIVEVGPSLKTVEAEIQRRREKYERGVQMVGQGVAKVLDTAGELVVKGIGYTLAATELVLSVPVVAAARGAVKVGKGAVEVAQFAKEQGIQARKDITEAGKEIGAVAIEFGKEIKDSVVGTVSNEITQAREALSATRDIMFYSAAARTMELVNGVFEKTKGGITKIGVPMARAEHAVRSMWNAGKVAKKGYSAAWRGEEAGRQLNKHESRARFLARFIIDKPNDLTLEELAQLSVIEESGGILGQIGQKVAERVAQHAEGALRAELALEEALAVEDATLKRFNAIMKQINKLSPALRNTASSKVLLEVRSQLRRASKEVGETQEKLSSNAGSAKMKLKGAFHNSKLGSIMSKIVSKVNRGKGEDQVNKGEAVEIVQETNTTEVHKRSKKGRMMNALRKALGMNV